MPTVSFHTLGCKVNVADTGAMVRQFLSRGFDVVPFGEPADVAVINTCSVTEQAEAKCRNAVRRATRASGESFVVVTGCYAQLRSESLAQIPGVGAVLGTADRTRVFSLLEKRAAEWTEVHVSCTADVARFEPGASSDRTRAFLKVQDGCDYNCSFCTIPDARGPSRSGSIAELVGQAQALASEGHLEIVLSGINVGLFGSDRGENLLDLLCALETGVAVPRMRVSSIEPNLLRDEVIEFVARSTKFQPHFHMPLQSGDDRVLGSMRRRYQTELYEGRVARIRKLLPEAAIGADVIVGFPGETEARFMNTVRFVNRLKLSYLHVFTYSERPGTVAPDLPEAVPHAERSRRSRFLRSVSDSLRRQFAAGMLGTLRSVLWERPGEGGAQFGYTDNYIRVCSRNSVGPQIQQIRLDEPHLSPTPAFAS